MPTDMFYAPRGGVGESPLGPADQPPPHEPPGVEAPRGPEAPPEETGPGGIDEVHRNMHPPRPANPASHDAPHVPVGQFLTVGGVVAEVNGIPIYARRVLSEIEPSLMAQVRLMDEQEFRAFAERQIQQAALEMIAEELHFASARRLLDARDHALARNLATRWRQQQIHEAEGSVELARRRALERGSTLHEQTDQKFRQYMIELRDQRRIEPRVQVTANEMREYYQRHLAEKFTAPDRIRFRVIRIDPWRMPSREEARSFVESLRRQIDEGESFADLAGEHNDDPFLLGRQGDAGWIERGAYRLAHVEEAAWALEAGQVSDVIEAEGALFLVRVEQREQGAVEPFDDARVQRRIFTTLREQHLHRQHEEIHQELLRDAVIRAPLAMDAGDEPAVGWEFDPEMLQIAVNMAVQNYRLWQNNGAVQGPARAAVGLER